MGAQWDLGSHYSSRSFHNSARQTGRATTLVQMTSVQPYCIESEPDRRRQGQTSARELPNDILLSIFYAARHIRRRKGRLPAFVLLTHVCRSWRNLALSTPGLWTWIDLANCSNNDMYDAFLSRSQPCLLHVTLLISSVRTFATGRRVHRAGSIGLKNARTTPDLVAIVEREIGRIKSLHITANDLPATVAFVLPRLRQIHAPALQYFGTSRDDAARWPGSRADSENIFQKGAPFLTSARISSFALGVPPLTNLTSLIIHHPLDSESPYVRFAEFRKLLATPSRLENLVLEGRIVDQFEFGEREPVSLPYLRSLHVELENEAKGDGHAFMLYLLHTPNIESLTLVNAMARPAIRSFLDFCEAKAPNPYPHLQRLSLNGGGNIGPMITEIARALPTVSDLRCIVWSTSSLLSNLISQAPRCSWCKGFHTVAGESHDDLVARVRASNETPWWPNLRSLTYQHAGADALRDFLLARKLLGCPISQLRTGFSVGPVMPDTWFQDHNVKVILVDVELEEREAAEPYRHEDFELEDVPIHLRQI